MSWDYYPPKRSVASVRQAAKKKAESLQKKDKSVQPVIIDGKIIVRSFWGKAWCKNLLSYHDFANRLPRGRSYVLNRAVIDLRIEATHIRALLAGSATYQVNVNIAPLSDAQWQLFKEDTSGQISSAIALLQGKLPTDVLKRIVDPHEGLFPTPAEISMDCDCPDSAQMCKHIAAAMYGVGHRLDTEPELLFKLRGVNQSELIQQVIGSGNQQALEHTRPQVAGNHLENIFGVKIVKKGAGLDNFLSSSVAKPTKKKAKTVEKTRSKGASKTKTKKKKSRAKPTATPGGKKKTSSRDYIL